MAAELSGNLCVEISEATDMRDPTLYFSLVSLCIG
jgi:hypothetical protein